MTSLPASESNAFFVPRAGLKRTLKYRAHFKVAYYLLLGLAAAVFLAGLAVVNYVVAGGEGFSALEIFLLVVLIPAACVCAARLQLKPLAFTTVHIRPDGITHEQAGASVEIPFADLDSVKVWHVPYLGGRFRLTLKNRRFFTFTVALERSEYILENLILARPDLLSETEFLSFRRTAVAADHSWARLDDRTVKKPWQTALFFLGLPLAAGLFVYAAFPSAVPDGQTFWPGGAFFLAAVFGLNLLLGLGAWAVAELFLLMRTSRKLQENPNHLRRDLPFERKVFYGAAALHLSLLVISLLTILLGTSGGAV